MATYLNAINYGPHLLESSGTDTYLPGQNLSLGDFSYRAYLFSGPSNAGRPQSGQLYPRGVR